MDVPDGKKITAKNNPDMEFINHLVKCRMSLPHHIISDSGNRKETPEEIIKGHDNAEEKNGSFMCNIFMKWEIDKSWCDQIDSTQAAKVTGFNHREHKIFKPILCTPLWLYFLLMSVMSVAVLCIQLSITEIDKLKQGGKQC